MEVSALIQQHKVQLRLLEQIEHFERQKQCAEQMLEVLPSELRQTAKSYSGKITKYDTIINKLKVSYHTR